MLLPFLNHLLNPILNLLTKRILLMELPNGHHKVVVVFFALFGRTINVDFNDLFIKVSTSAEMNRGKTTKQKHFNFDI